MLGSRPHSGVPQETRNALPQSEIRRVTSFVVAATEHPVPDEIAGLIAASAGSVNRFRRYGGVVYGQSSGSNPERSV